MTDFQGKRLLILGGNAETVSLVATANQLGIHTIVADPNPHAPAKREAAEQHDIDGFDIDGLVTLSRRRSVDGVLVGVADILVRPYQQVCERLGFPCYANQESAVAFGNKSGFKMACKRFGVPDIPGVLVTAQEVAETLRLTRLPAMIKPVDNGGGVGMRICGQPSQIDTCAAEVLEHSRSAHFLIERYMECDDMFAYYTFKEGKAYLSATADRITTKRQGGMSPVCLAARYPSRHTNAFATQMHPKLVRMFNGLGVHAGVLSIQFFVENGEFYAYDPGFRLQGEGPHIHLKAIHGFDHLKMLIEFALTGLMGEEDFIDVNDYNLGGKVSATLWVLAGNGTIRSLQGMDLVAQDPRVIAVSQRLCEGDHIFPHMLGTERQVLARIYLVGDSREELTVSSERIRSKLAVFDDSGTDMVLDWVNPNHLL